MQVHQRKNKMANTIDMQLMRYINLFSKICRVSTNYCFKYNNQLIFLVPKSKVSFAIGKGAINVKKLSQIIGKKIKIIALPDRDDAVKMFDFMKVLIDPIELNNVEVKSGVLIVSANRMNKASLIGRNRIKEKELMQILKNLFDLELKIV